MTIASSQRGARDIVVGSRGLTIPCDAGQHRADAPVMSPPSESRLPMDVDEMGEASFPASDPPAVWTWDVAPAPTVAPDPESGSPVDESRSGGVRLPGLDI
jgi:hypothetical protein